MPFKFVESVGLFLMKNTARFKSVYFFNLEYVENAFFDICARDIIKMAYVSLEFC